jgi:hypothetical protein
MTVVTQQSHGVVGCPSSIPTSRRSLQASSNRPDAGVYTPPRTLSPSNYGLASADCKIVQIKQLIDFFEGLNFRASPAHGCFVGFVVTTDRWVHVFMSWPA